MYEFRALLDRFWVTRREDKELYFSLKRTLPDYRRRVNELLGWNRSRARTSSSSSPRRWFSWGTAAMRGLA